MRHATSQIQPPLIRIDKLRVMTSLKFHPGGPPAADQLAGLRLWLLCLAVFVAIETLDRLAVAIWAIVTGTGFGLPLLGSFAYGILDDAATGLMLGAPFLFGLGLLVPMWRWRAARLAAHMVFFVMLGVLVFAELGEMFFWNEFDSRYNSIAVNYLIFPREVIGNIRESFNLAILLPLVALLAGSLYAGLRRPLVAALAAAPGRAIRIRLCAAAMAALGLGATTAWVVPLDPFLDRTVNEVARNGLHSLLHAGLTNDEKFDGLYPTLPDAEANRLARRLVAQDNTRFLQPDDRLGLVRRVDNGAAARRLNVVLVIEESFGSVYVDGLDNNGPESISPRLTALARDGLLFTNVYATGNRTVRGLEALLTSFPPIPGISTTRRAGSEGMDSLPFLLKRFGYQTAFLYGGRAAFDNMGHYWSTIGFDRVLEQRDIAEVGFKTIWGAADEFLFGEALRRLDSMTATGTPVFLSLLTVSNHRPYVYPAGRIAKDPAQKRKENSASYADWAFGDFIERARGHAWFKDTVFVFIGDHGPRVYGAAQVPVPSYRVPLLFYAPAHVAPERNDALGSSMDMAPTLLGLLGLSYDSPFFGVDLRRVPPGGGRVAMEHNFSIALGDGRNVAMLLPGRQQRGWSMRPGPQELVPQPEPDRALVDQAIGLYQTAHRLFYSRHYHQLAGAP
ncbi:MAG: sulfatase-like hydrolase/transferase [Alphaproteobacteria bacterium]|nr:sulfatase-like hydrolase/transferase [Alphaproteobacteria bacterium]